jgi:hypothetical protein
MNSTRIVYSLWSSRKLITIFCGFDKKPKENSEFALPFRNTRLGDTSDSNHASAEQMKMVRYEIAVNRVGKIAVPRFGAKSSAVAKPLILSQPPVPRGRQYSVIRRWLIWVCLTVASMACRGGVTDVLFLPFV